MHNYMVDDTTSRLPMRVEVNARVLAPMLLEGLGRELEAALATSLRPLLDRIAETEKRCEHLATCVAELELQVAEARPRRRGC